MEENKNQQKQECILTEDELEDFKIAAEISKEHMKYYKEALEKLKEEEQEQEEPIHKK